MAEGISMREVVATGVAFFLIAIVFPIALLEVADANTTGWNAAVITIFQTLLPILAVIGVAVRFIPRLRK